MRLLADTRVVEIEEIVDRWPGERFSYFKVMDGAGNIYILRREEGQEKWDLVMFQRSSAQSQDMTTDAIRRLTGSALRR
jgi:hypothetical protein